MSWNWTVLKRRSSPCSRLCSSTLTQVLLRSNQVFRRVPGFAVFPVFGAFEVGGEDDGLLAFDGFEGEDVPGVDGDDVGCDEVDLVNCVGDMGGGNAAHVGSPNHVDRALNLHA